MVALVPTSYDDATLPPVIPEAEPRIPYGPQPPKWYKQPPKPKLATVLAKAERERDDHAFRVEQGFKMLRRINMDENLTGVFERLARKTINGEVEKVQLPGLRDETDAAVGFVSQMDWIYEALYRSSLDREAANSKEDLCAYLAENAQRQYSRSGGGDLKAAKAFNLWVFGCVAEFTGIDVDNEECGLRMRLIDPQTIFPVWEGERGLQSVYLKYQTTASDFIGTFGSLDDFDEEAVIAKASDGEEGYDPNYLGEVVEYWDRHWYLIAFEDKQIVLGEHKYAEVPFIVTPGNFGQPIGITTPTLTRYANGSYWSTDRIHDLKRIYQPFLERRVPSHELKEAVAGIIATKTRRSMNPARTVRAGVLTYEDESPEFKDDEGHVNKVRAEDEVETEEASIALDPQVSSALFAIIQQAEATSTPSSLIAGQAPMSQGSGTALNVLARSGFERWALFVKVLEQHETMVTEQRLRFLRDFGNLLGMDGVIYVPRRGRPNVRTGQSAAHEVTPDLLRETGIRVAVTFRRFNPSELTSLSQGVGMLRSINLIGRRDAIEIIGYTADPDRAIEDMDREMLNEVPEVAQMKMLNRLIDELKEAGWRGDDEDVEQLAYDLMYVASRVDIESDNREAEQAQAKQMKLQATMMSPSVNGMSLPDFGIQPGNLGGRNAGPESPAAPAEMPGVPPPRGY